MDNPNLFMRTAYVSVLLLFLITAILVHAIDHEDRNTGNGSVQQVKRGRSKVAKARSAIEVYSICGEKNAICFGDTDICPQGKNCTFMTAIKKVHNGYRFNVFATVTNPKAYVSVGISEVGNIMKDSLLVACQDETNTDAPAYLQSYWSKEKGTANINEIYIHDIIYGAGKFSLTNGVISCEFVMNPKFNVMNPPVWFNLDKRQYKILLASGKYNKSRTYPTKLEYHFTARRLSKKYDLKGAGTTVHSFPILAGIGILCYFYKVYLLDDTTAMTSGSTSVRKINLLSTE